ncbi:hypothetical protein EYF80_012826 [Liparis tanakae]|uniref:Uncharacterized protein n=1 Tax=Liparis tanakae TaxID=230148 RepID=A0A4Z2IGB3_9TELE|nr:hypothetical protein EYF80_012826 [Liparis tanakae]
MRCYLRVKTSENRVEPDKAINTESIIAPRGAAGQGGRERPHLKGQRLERKQAGQTMMEAQGCNFPLQLVPGDYHLALEP